MDLQNNKTYWRGLEELNKDEEFVKNAEREFPDYVPVKEFNRDEFSLEDEGTHRRDFLKLLGFGVAAASLAACEAPVRKAIPYVTKPEDVDPSIPNYYASAFVDGSEFGSVVVKTREGRPIKVEGNKFYSYTEGSGSIKSEASVLSLYDSARYKSPIADGKKAKWDDVDKAIIDELTKISNSGGTIALVSPSVYSPTYLKAIKKFQSAFSGAKLIQYDPISLKGLKDASNAVLGKDIIPSFDFSKAKTIVGFECDFLGTWLSPVEFSRQYSKTRKLSKTKKTMSRHYQFETMLSLSGANADYRESIKPSSLGFYVASLYNKIAKATGNETINVPAIESKTIDKAAKD